MVDAGEFKVYSEQEAAAFLKMTLRQLADRRRAGKINYIRDGNYIAYTAQHLQDYAKAADKRPSTPSAKKPLSKAVPAGTDVVQDIFGTPLIRRPPRKQ